MNNKNSSNEIIDRHKNSLNVHKYSNKQKIVQMTV